MTDGRRKNPRLVEEPMRQEQNRLNDYNESDETCSQAHATLDSQTRHSDCCYDFAAVFGAKCKKSLDFHRCPNFGLCASAWRGPDWLPSASVPSRSHGRKILSLHRRRLTLLNPPLKPQQILCRRCKLTAV